MPNKKTAAQRQPYVDAMKGFGILCVVIGHFIEYHRGTAPGINALFTCIYLFHMAIFCTASGLVAKFSLRKLVTQQLWLYLISQAGITAFRAAALKDNIVDQGGWLQNVLLPWRHMWYLYALIFWHLTLPLLCLLRDRLGLAGSCLGMALAVAVGLAGGLIDWPFMLVRVFAFFPFYAFGVLFRPQLDTLAAFAAQNRAARLLPAAGLAVGYGLYFIRVFCSETILDNSAELFHDVSYAGGDRPEYRIVFYLVGIATTAALVAAFSSGRRLTGLGRRTLAIYLLHLPILALLGQLQLFEPLRGAPVALPVLWYTLLAAAALAVLNWQPVQTLFDFAANCWYKRGKS